MILLDAKSGGFYAGVIVRLDLIAVYSHPLGRSGVNPHLVIPPGRHTGVFTLPRLNRNRRAARIHLANNLRLRHRTLQVVERVAIVLVEGLVAFALRIKVEREVGHGTLADEIHFRRARNDGDEWE